MDLREENGNRASMPPLRVGVCQRAPCGRQQCVHALREARSSVEKKSLRRLKDMSCGPGPASMTVSMRRPWRPWRCEQCEARLKQLVLHAEQMRAMRLFCYAGHAVLACWLVFLVVLFYAKGACVRCVNIVQRITHGETACRAAVPAQRASACRPSACPVAAGVAVQRPVEH